MAASQNGKELATQVPEKEKTKKSEEKASKKRAKKAADDDDASEESSFVDPKEDSFDAVTKFSALKPGRYYKIVKLTNYRNHRVVAVPVIGFEGTFKNFNNLVQQ